MRRWARAVAAGCGCALVAVLGGCTGGPAPTPSPTRATGTSAAASPEVTGRCEVTAATTAGIPAAVAAQSPGAVYGSGGLWVAAWWLDADALAQVRSGGLGSGAFPYQEKYATWTVVDGKVTDALGAPSVSVERLDGPGRGRGDAGGYASASQADASVWHWWPTGVEFSARGCWRVSEYVGDRHLDYVVRI